MVEILFWGSIIIIIFSYFGYPISLYLFALLRGKDVKKSAFTPKVTIIITAFNEEKRINAKLENTLSLEYPREKLQILVASDGSTDRTNKLVKDLSEEELVIVMRRLGIQRLDLTSDEQRAVSSHRLLAHCTYCDKELTPQAAYCPHCGKHV